MVEARNQEDRVIAETVAPARLEQDSTLPGALTDQRRGIFGMAQIDQHALEARGALGFGDIREIREQFEQIGLVRSARTGIAGRVDAGRAAQCIDLQPRVVGDGRQSAVTRRVARLEDGVLDEGQAGLLGLGDAVLALRADMDPGLGQQAFDLTDLAGVVAGQDDGLADMRSRHEPQTSSAARCAAWMERMPAAPSSSSASSSARVKGWPSAVPWTSMKRPSPSITRFMSVSADESSA